MSASSRRTSWVFSRNPRARSWVGRESHDKHKTTLNRNGKALLDNLIRDLRYGLRGLIRSPGFTLVAVLTIWEAVPALGLVRPLFTSSPSRIIASAQWLFANGLWNDISVSCC